MRKTSLVADASALVSLASVSLLSQVLNLLTDDFRALGEIEKQIGEMVVLSPIILKVLVIRGIIDKRQALTKLDEMAGRRDWLGRPIYRYAKKYFEEFL
ncbi:hypothetical protein C4E22_06540 [ANME-1 cluster archaeon AG-394-G06]|nr:hypothetical protein [ANME-1 cluster archaeon AG-394-G06]